MKTNRRKHWNDRRLIFKNHGRGQGALILAARMFKPGSLVNRALHRAADLYWWHFRFKRWTRSGFDRGGQDA